MVYNNRSKSKKDGYTLKDILTVKILYTDGLKYEDIKKSPLLTDEDRIFADGFKKTEDKISRLSSAYLKRKYVGDWALLKTGKPVSDKLCFSISHCDGLTAFVTAKNSVGIDVENIRPIDNGLKAFACHECELNACSGDKDFFAVWTAKESLVKAEGGGMSAHPNNVLSLPFTGKKEYRGQAYYSVGLTLGEYALSVTRKGEEEFKIKIEEESIF